MSFNKNTVILPRKIVITSKHFLIVVSIAVSSLMSVFVYKNKEFTKLLRHLFNNEKKCENIPAGCGDFTHIKDFNEAFRQARKEGYDLFLWRDQARITVYGIKTKGLIDMYTTQYVEEMHPRIHFERREINQWLEKNFIISVSTKVAQLAGSGDDSSKIAEMMHFRHSQNSQLETLSQLEGRLTLKNRAKRQGGNGDSGGNYDDKQGTLYAEYTYGLPYYLHEKLHKIDLGHQPHGVDSTTVLSHQPGFVFLFASLLDQQKIKHFNGNENSLSYLMSNKEMFVRFFTLFYYWEKYTGSFYSGDKVFKKQECGLEGYRKKVTVEDLTLMLQKNYYQVENDILPFVAIVSLEKLTLWMNWFYGYETDAAVGL